MQAQGTYGQLLTLMERNFKTDLTASSPRARKLYFKSEGFGYSQDLVSSALLRGGSRQPTAPVRGNTDVSGQIDTELNALTMLLHAACGDLTTTQSGGTGGTAITVTAGTISDQFLTLTAAGHGLTGSSVGGNVYIASSDLTPSGLRNTVAAIVDIPSSSTITLRVQAGLAQGSITLGTTTFTLNQTGAAYTHTIRSGGKLASYIIEKGFTDIGQYFKYSGCKCGSMNLNLTAAGLLDLSTSWLGASETTSATALDSTPTDPGKASFDGLGISSANFKLDTVAVAVNYPKTFTLSLDNALDGDTYTIGGQGTRGAVNTGVNKASGSITCIFENSGVSGSGAGYDLYAKAKAGTPVAWDITVNRGTGAGTLGNESLQIILAECLLKPKAPPITGPAGVMLSLDYEAYVNTGSEAVKFVVKNASGPGIMI